MPSYTGLTTRAMLQAELDLKIVERTNIETKIQAATAADVLNVLSVQKAVIDKRIEELMNLTGVSVLTNPLSANPLCLFGIKSRYLESSGYTFSSEWGDARNELHISNSILSLLGSNKDYQGNDFTQAYKGIEKPFTSYNLPFSEEYSLYSKERFHYNTSTTYNYSPILVGLLPLKNTTNADIVIDVNLISSGYSTYTYSSLNYYVPNKTNAERNLIDTVTFNSAINTTANGTTNSLQSNITVPANTTILVAGIGHYRYYTTQTMMAGFGWKNISNIYPSGIETDELLANCILHKTRNSVGRFDSFVDLFKTVSS